MRRPGFLRRIAARIPAWVLSTGLFLSAGATELWYLAPATNWNEALPIGNGRIGARVFGGVTNEHLQFNECTLWTGRPREYQHEGASRFLPVLRDLCNESRRLDLEARALGEQGDADQAARKREASQARQKEAEAIGMKEFMSVPLRQVA